MLASTYPSRRSQNHKKHKSLVVDIKQLTIDQLRQDVLIFVGRTDMIICPVATVLAYLALHGPGEGPHFQLECGQTLTHPCLVSTYRKTSGLRYTKIMVDFCLPAERPLCRFLLPMSNKGTQLFTCRNCPCICPFQLNAAVRTCLLQFFPLEVH